MMVLGVSFSFWPNGSIDWVVTGFCASACCGEPKPISTAAIAKKGTRNGARRQRGIEVSLRLKLRATTESSVTRAAKRAVPEMHAFTHGLLGGIAGALANAAVLPI